MAGIHFGYYGRILSLRPLHVAAEEDYVSLQAGIPLYGPRVRKEAVFPAE